MGAPISRNRHHPKRSPTWRFDTRPVPPDDTPDEREEKAKLIQEFLERKSDSAHAKSSTDVNKI